MLQGKYSAILSTFIKLPFVVKIFVWSIFEWSVYTGITVYLVNEPVDEISNNVAYAQSDQSFCLSLEYSMNVKLLTKHHLEVLSLKGCYIGSYESTLVKMPHCWKSH